MLVVLKKNQNIFRYVRNFYSGLYRGNWIKEVIHDIREEISIRRTFP